MVSASAMGTGFDWGTSEARPGGEPACDVGTLDDMRTIIAPLRAPQIHANENEDDKMAVGNHHTKNNPSSRESAHPGESRPEDLEAVLRAAAGAKYDDRPTGWRWP